MKSKFRKFFTKVVNAVNTPIVRNISKFSFHLLQTIDLVKQRNPLTITAASLSLANSLAESFNLPQLSALEAYIESLDVIPGFGNLPQLLFSSDIYASLEKETIFSSEEGEELIEIKISDNDKLYITQFKNGEGYTGSAGADVGLEFFYTRNFDFEKLFANIWAHYPYGIYLRRNKQEHTLEMRALPATAPAYIGDYDLNEFFSRLKRARDASISRSFLLYGPPGVGKSTFVLDIAYKHLPRIIKIDPAVARTLETGELEFFISQLRPQVLLLEDFDRAYTSVDMALFMIENIKNSHPEIVLFATVNDIGKLDPALLRPGRFDKSMWFGYPDSSDTTQILNLFFDQYNKQVPSEMRKRISALSVGLSPAYLRELTIESQNFSNALFEEETRDTISEYRDRMIREIRAFAPEEIDDGDDQIDSMDARRQLIFEIKDSLHPDEWSGLKDQIFLAHGEGLDQEDFD